ncbi:MAG: Cna B-type domain-containing protein [Anaerovoracaceae bacterium]|jgi:LPXTG-motif cell wall-anchored protein
MSRSGATASLSSITIDGNSTEAESVSASLITSYGTLNIEDGTVLQNNSITSTAYFKSLGGAIRVYGGTLNMTGGTITGNTANFGGGVFVGAGTMNMSGGVISNNKAVSMYNTRYSMTFPASGGGICVYDNNAVLNVSDSAQIINNSSEETGGGISLGIFLPSNYAETLNMTGGTVSGNTAGSAGGGIFVQGGRYETAIGTANISGGTISNNSMTGEGDENDSFGGGGIYVNGSSTYYNGVVNLTNVLITDNTATLQGGGYAACPISVTRIYVNDGAAIYANTASSADEIYILASNDYGTHSGDPTYDISSTMLGGTPYVWKYSSDDTEVPYNDLVGTLDADNNEELALYTDVTSDATAVSLAAVTITGNTSATRGGGIGSNGTVNIGTASDTIDITVNKVWENDTSSDRPDSIRVNIYRTTEGSDEDPEYVGYETMSPDSSGDWPSITISNLPEADSDGNTYTYTVEEASVDGYASTVTGNQDDGFTITNTATVSIPVTKVWNGGTGSKAVIHLYADGEEVDSCTLIEDNSWTYTFSDLDKLNSDGDTIEYTISEDSVDGYKTSISGDQDNGYTVTNTKVATTDGNTVKNTNKNDKDKDNKKNTTENPKTGDSSNTGLYLIALLTAAGAALFIAIRKKKRI